VSTSDGDDAGSSRDGSDGGPGLLVEEVERNWVEQPLEQTVRVRAAAGVPRCRAP
jgi:hypothetical protein